MTSIHEVVARIVGLVKARGADVDAFRDEVLLLAQDTARDISQTVNHDLTGQLRSALQFLFALADGASAARNDGKGHANPEAADPFQLEP